MTLHEGIKGIVLKRKANKWVLYCEHFDWRDKVPFVRFSLWLLLIAAIFLSTMSEKLKPCIQRHVMYCTPLIAIDFYCP